MAIIICPECGKEMSDSLKKCPHCGYHKKKQIKIPTNPLKNLSGNTRKFIGIGAIAAIVLIIGIIVSVNKLNNPVNKYIDEIYAGNVDSASQIYDKNIKDNEKNETIVKTKLLDEIEDTKESYINKKATYDDVVSIIRKIGKCPLVSSDSSKAVLEIQDLKSSREAYDEAEKYANDNDYYNAVNKYKDVISEDENYETAKSKVTEMTNKYKDEVLASVDEYVASSSYSAAADLLTKALSLKPGDSDLINRQKEVESLKVAKEAEEAEAKMVAAMENQKVAVIGDPYIKVQSDRLKALYPDMLIAQVINNSDKTVQSYTVAFVGFDSNGYPVKFQWQNKFNGASYENSGYNDNCNLAPGAVSDTNGGWSLDDDYCGKISTLYACVKSAKFYDGTTWTNDYYTYWTKKYNGKPLQ